MFRWLATERSSRAQHAALTTCVAAIAIQVAACSTTGGDELPRPLTAQQVPAARIVDGCSGSESEAPKSFTSALADAAAGRLTTEGMGRLADERSPKTDYLGAAMSLSQVLAGTPVQKLASSLADARKRPICDKGQDDAGTGDIFPPLDSSRAR